MLTKYKPIIIKVDIVRYKPMLVKERLASPKIGRSKLIKFLMANWSRGLVLWPCDIIVVISNWFFDILFIYNLTKLKLFCFVRWVKITFKG